MTKPQIKKMLKELMAKANDLFEYAQHTQGETEETRDDLEAYSDDYGLNKKQEEKLEWCEEVIEIMETLINDLECTIYDIENKIEE